MTDKKHDGFYISGYVSCQYEPLPPVDFWRKFIEWVEANHWGFGGSVGPEMDKQGRIYEKEARGPVGELIIT